MKRIIALTSVAFACAVSANAATIFYTDTKVVEPRDTRFDSALPVAFTIPKFDASQGTLTSVTLNVSGSAVSSLNFTNLGPANSLIRASQTNALFIKYGASVLAQNNFVWLTTAYPSYVTVTPNGGVFSQSWGPITVSASNNYTFAGDLANFTGIGNIPVEGQFDDWFDFSATGGNYKWRAETTSTFIANVSYNYTPVPEPSTFALGFIGIAAVAFFRRNRA